MRELRRHEEYAHTIEQNSAVDSAIGASEKMNQGPEVANADKSSVGGGLMRPMLWTGVIDGLTGIALMMDESIENERNPSLGPGCGCKNKHGESTYY